VFPIDQSENQVLLRPRRRLLILAAVALATMMVPVGGEATGTASSGSGRTSETAATSGACAGVGGNLIGHSHPYLMGFTVLNPASPFYAAEEGDSLSATLTVTPEDRCGVTAQPGRAHYLTTGGSAASPADYQAIGPPAVESDQMCVEVPPAPPHADCPEAMPETIPVPLTLVEDSVAESAVESFLFDIVDGEPFPPATFRPTEAPVHIIDDDGSARVSLEPTVSGGSTMAYRSGEPSIVEIPVFWAGSGTPGNVHYTVGPGSPAPTLDVDYRVESANPLPASAFSPTRAGGRLAFIRIRILNNAGPDGLPAKELDEIINISLDPGGYQVEGDHDSTTLRILDGGSDTQAPRTRFHHPKHKKRYKRNAFQLREMHIFYNEPGGSGVKRVQIAISRKKKNGKCQWWNGNRFRVGRCNPVPGKFWKKTKYDNFVDWYVYRVPAFKPTAGTNIRFYRGYARGLDHAGNVEDRFIKKRNKNTFWIKRR